MTAVLEEKTGNTIASGHTIVTGAERNGMTLIAVAMRADAGQVAQDSIQLFDYGFNNFQRVEVPGGSVVIPNGNTLDQLDNCGDGGTGRFGDSRLLLQ